MSKLIELYEVGGQSPWLDNLKREWLESGEIQRWVDRGVRGITSNPSIFQKAIESGEAYDEQFRELTLSGTSVRDAYWELVVSDIRAALRILAPVHSSSNGVDGYVSVEVDPSLAHDRDGTIDAARRLDELIDEPNVYVKIPGTAEGVPAIEQMVSEGRCINVTLIFSLGRYEEVIESYLRGLEAHEGDLSSINSVASFFISRVDSEIDRRLAAEGSDTALALTGTAAYTQGQLAYRIFTERFSGPRWDALVARGANVQRPLWASTSTKNPDYPDTLYVDTLIGPRTVNTLPDATLADFEDHGTVARTIDADVDASLERWSSLEGIVDLADVSATLEREGVASFQKSFDDLLEVLARKAASF